MEIDSKSAHKYKEEDAMKKASDQSNGGDDESCGEEIVLQVGGSKRSAQEDDEMKAISPKQKNLKLQHQGIAKTKMERSTPESESRSSSSARGEQVDDQIETTKAEMDEIMEENQRLKLYLERILKDYRTLQLQYRNAIQQEAAKTDDPNINSTDPRHEDDHTEEPDELIDLSLGISSRDRMKDNSRKTVPTNELNVVEGGNKLEGLKLGLDCSKYEVLEKLSSNPTPENSVEEVKEEGREGDNWQPKSTMKNTRDGGDIDEISQQNPTKRARVSVRVRCDTPTMNDGCQWRKYGQKIAKGNPCPRAYYRCTVAPSCPVRKQVQRCAEDMSILITTYEGTHNHPLPVSATAMASTTSAAASMLMSGSSTSGTAQGSSSNTTNLNGLNLYLSNNSRSSKPFYLPNSSISSSPSYPTITLDLTSSTSSSSYPSSNLTRLGSYPPRYSTTNLNFSSLDSSSSNPLPISWTNGMLSYGSQQHYNRNPSPASSLSFAGSQPSETLFQSYLQKAIPSNPSQQPLPQDTIAAATKAITSDPSFQSALAAALTSIIGSSGSNATTLSSSTSQMFSEKSGVINSSKISDQTFPILSSFPSTSSNASFLIKSSSSVSISQGSESMLLSPPFPFSNLNGKPTSSPGDNNSKDHRGV